MSSNKITIGITTYNAADTLSAAVESALAQDYPDFEIVIVDDVSGDETWNILLDLQSQFPQKIRVFRNEWNLGVAGTRNRILAEAKGDFVCFFDDDDVSVPDRIKKQMSRILDYEHGFAHENAVICHAARLQKFPDGTEFFAGTMGCDVGRMAPHGNDMAARILYNKKIYGGDGAMATCSQMARLSTYRQLGGFDENFRRMEDTEFNVRLALSGGHFVGIDEPLVAQTMTQAGDKQIQDERKYALMLYHKYEEFLAAQGRGDFDARWVEAKHDYWEGYRLRFLIRILFLFLVYPVLSFGRVVHALPNFSYNASIRKFYAKEKGMAAS